MQIQPTKILSGRRITLPKEFTDQIKLGEGDFVGLFISKNTLIVGPIEVTKK